MTMSVYEPCLHGKSLCILRFQGLLNPPAPPNQEPGCWGRPGQEWIKYDKIIPVWDRFLFDTY